MSTKPYAAPDPSRAVLRLGGEDRAKFLQGLVSNDVTEVGPERAVWTALLTPQGKYLFDFFLVASGDEWLLEGEAERLVDLRKRLLPYRLRSKVTIGEPDPSLGVWIAWNEGGQPLPGFEMPGQTRPLGDGVAFADPRRASLGARLILPRDGAAAALAEFADGDRTQWDVLRIAEGVPDGSRDLLIDKTVLMEAGFEPLGGVSFSKGCYMGQELTARTKYRGLVKRRLVPVAFDGTPPAPGTIISRADGGEAGEIRSGVPGSALGIVRLDAFEDQGLTLPDGRRITISPPPWFEGAATPS